MSPINITDRETENMIRRLAASRSIGLTEAVRIAVRNELGEAEGVVVSSPPTDNSGLVKALDDVIRSTTLEYTRLLAKQRGTKSVGSRVYQMLGRNGPVGTLAKLVDRPTTGLEFLVSIGRFNLTAEAIALDPKFASIIPEDVRARAQTNLDAVDPKKKRN